MGIRIKTILVISIVLLSSLIISWDFNLKANNHNNKMNSNITSKSNKSPRSGNFDWGEIEVISESIPDQNNNINQSSNPKIAVEEDKIYMVWHDATDYNGAGGDYDIFYRYYDGTKWSKIQVISEPVKGQNISTGDSYGPDIAIENGMIYVVWHDYNNTDNSGSDRDIFYRCNLTGSSWEDIQVISEPIFGQNFHTGGAEESEIVVENSNIYVVWRSFNNTNGAGIDGEIFYRCNLTGLNWESTQVISEPVNGKDFNVEFSTEPAIAVENDKIYVVWEDKNNTNSASGASLNIDIFYRCNITGISWEDIQVISEPIFGKDFNTADSQIPAIAVENGNIYIVWFDNNNTLDSGDDLDILYRCNLTGSSWENIQVISEPSYGVNFNIGDSTVPTIVVKNSRIYVVWYDSNNTNGAGSDSEIFYKCKFNDHSWEPVQVISEPIEGSNFHIGRSHFPDITVNLGKSFIVWRDENNTNGAGTDCDIFYRCIKDPSPLFLNQPNVSPTFGNTSTNFNFTIKYFQYNNIPSTEISVNINGTEYSMLEVNQANTNYVDGKEYYFNIKNLDIGVHTYQFYVSDDTFTWLTSLVNNPTVYNTPPNITTKDNLIAFEDVYYEVNYEFEDIDVINIDQPISWDFSTNANWLEFEPITGVLNGTPSNDDVGEYWINITINDIIDVDYTNFTLIVNGLNDPPKILTEDIAIAIEDEFYEVDYDAEDADNIASELNWNIITNAEWLAFDPITAIINGTPTNDDIGGNWVNISVSDNEYIDHSNFTLTVVNINDPPRIITVDNLTAIEDELYEVLYEAKDVDNAYYELTWEFATNAKWLIFDTTTLSIKGLPSNDDVGDYWINVSVRDTEYIDYTNFTLTVVNSNDPPMITTEDRTNAVVDELYSVNYEAEEIDPTDDKLTWSLITDAGYWLTIDTTTGWLNGVPSKNDYGTYWVNISVTDGESGWDHHNFTIQISMDNNPPELLNGSITPSEGDMNTEFTFSVRYYDADRQVPLFVQVIIDNTSYYMELQPGENAFNGTYKYTTTLSKGTHVYYFTASDGIETVKTDNSTTQEIKKVINASKQEIFGYLLIWIPIITIILLLLINLFIYKKKKKAEIPTLRAEILQKPPKHIALPGEITSTEIAQPLPITAIISEQLPTPKAQAQPTTATPGEKVPVQSLAPTSVTTQFQLPQATLSKAQQLHLLRERFLRGEVIEETYIKLRSEIEGGPDKDITDIDKEFEEQSIIGKRQSEPIEESTLQMAIESEPKQIPQEVTQKQSAELGSVVKQREQIQRELPSTPEPEGEEQWPQPSAQVQEQTKSIMKEKIDDE